jgi:adenylate cyclase
MHLKLGPKTRWNLGRILPFGLIWLVTGLVFLLSDRLAMGNNPAPLGAIDLTPRVVFFASFAVFLMGLFIGFLEVVLVDRLFRNTSLVKTIIYKFFLYIFFFTLIISLFYPIAASIELGVPINDALVYEKFWSFWGSYAFWSTGLQLTFSLFLCLIYASISEHLGYSVLKNFFTGKYHTPKQEERIFLFLDMYDSTMIAEALGHIRYFTFLQRYYNDLADAVIQNEGEVYQYIGDEIVVTWPMKKGVRNSNCVNCFFAMKKALEHRAGRYQKEFGYVPRFKGGMHIGSVTTGEVGALKKEIVYTGDVLNTAARIQGLCRPLNQDILLSADLFDKLSLPSSYVKRHLGKFELKGKQHQMEILTIEKTRNDTKQLGRVSRP